MSGTIAPFTESAIYPGIHLGGQSPLILAGLAKLLLQPRWTAAHRQNGDDGYVAVVELVVDRVGKTTGQQSISAEMLFVNAGIDAKGFDIRDQTVEEPASDAGLKAVVECLA